MALARGEKKVTSVPRSRWILSCAPSRLSRISPSVIFRVPGAFPETWSFLQSPSAPGAVV